jgi:hypothetical protein
MLGFIRKFQEAGATTGAISDAIEADMRYEI